MKGGTLLLWCLILLMMALAYLFFRFLVHFGVLLLP